MGVLHQLTSDQVPFHWDFTAQRAFEEIKELAVKCKDHDRKLLEVYQAIWHSRGYAGIFYLLSLLISDLASIL